MLLPPLTISVFRSERHIFLTVGVIAVFSFFAHNSTHDYCFDIISDFASYLFSSKDREIYKCKGYIMIILLKLVNVKVIS